MFLYEIKNANKKLQTFGSNQPKIQPQLVYLEEKNQPSQALVLNFGQYLPCFVSFSFDTDYTENHDFLILTDYSAVWSHEGTVWEGFFTRFSPHRQPCPGSYSGWPGFVRIQEKCCCKYATSCDAQSVFKTSKNMLCI